MPIPGSSRDKALKESKQQQAPEFLQEIVEPAARVEELVEEKPKKRLFGRRKKKTD